MKPGEIITLGRHRLMCGDATNRDDVMRLLTPLSVPPCQYPPKLGGSEGGPERVNLVLTDPPYGIRIQHGSGNIGGDTPLSFHDIPPKLGGNEGGKILHANIFPTLQGDESSETARKNYEIARELTDKLIIWGGSYFTDFLPVSGGWLFWDKNRRNMDFSDGELAWRSWGKKITYYKQTWNGVCMEGNYVLNARYQFSRKARIHPTQKPVELHMKILEDFSQPDDVILDCFGGSGTTLIACEMTGRRCLMMEISPEYCGIIRERYEKVKAEFPLTASGLQ